MTSRRRLRTRYDRPNEPVDPVQVKEVSPFPPAPTPVQLPTLEALTGAPAAPTEGAAVAPAVERPRKRRGLALLLVVGLALVAFATGLLVFNSVVMPQLIHGIGQVQVPDIHNLTLDQAEQALRSMNLQVSR